MHYLLINESSLFWAGDGTSEWMIGVGTKKKPGELGERRFIAGAWKTRGRVERGGERRRGGEGRWMAKGKIRCCKANTFVEFSGHGHTPQTPVSL